METGTEAKSALLHDKENGKFDQEPGVTESTKFGSHGDEPVKRKGPVLEAFGNAKTVKKTIIQVGLVSLWRFNLIKGEGFQEHLSGLICWKQSYFCLKDENFIG